MIGLWPIARRTVLLASIALLGTSLWQQLFMHTDLILSVPVKGEVMPDITGTLAPPARHDSGIMQAARDLFETIDRPAAALPVVTKPDAPPTIVLVGTAFGPPSFAVIRPAINLPSRRIAEGNVIGEWTIEAIRRNDVILRKAKTKWKLGFPPTIPIECHDGSCP